MSENNRSFYLASQSPRRHKILTEYLGLDVTVIPNLSNEDLEPKKNDLQGLQDWIQELSLQKAWVSKSDLNGVVIGMDTVVVVGKQVLGKPADLLEAKDMLKKISGSTHLVLSGSALLDTQTKRSTTGFEMSSITFQKLTDDDIENYIHHNEVLDKAGAYGVQDLLYQWVHKVEGGYFNIMGVPLFSLKKQIRAF